eukprot:SAG31_NODE_3002_length_4798_cov_2.473292_6_plen_205_part_01
MAGGSSDQLILEDDGESLIVEIAGQIYCVQRDTGDVFATRTSSKPELVGRWDSSESRIVLISSRPESPVANDVGDCGDESANADLSGYASDASTLSGGCALALTPKASSSMDNLEDALEDLCLSPQDAAGMSSDQCTEVQNDEPQRREQPSVCTNFMASLRPTLEPLLREQSVPWSVVAPLLEHIESEAEAAEALENPSEFLNGL